jgi:hypothetical protein
VFRYGGRHTNRVRLLKISGVVAATAPFRCYESLRWERKLSAVDVRAPIFICGHWQSGHSLAQQLFACDPRFATLRLRHAVQPAACLTMQPILRRFLQRRLPEHRPADKLPLHLDAPQGDDLALGLLTGLSFYNAWYFPLSAAAVFRESVLMEGLSTAVLVNWQRQYRRLLQKILCESGRESIAIRSAANTARMPQLLKEFPDARFVYCHRNPFEVFAASLERWEALTRAFSLSRRALPPEDVERLTLDWYEQLLGRYLTDRRLISADRLIEVAYDDLQQRPVEAMHRVYEAIGLDGFSDVRPIMERLPGEQAWDLAGSRPLTPQQRDVVAGRWEFAFREWGYSL